VNKNGNLRCASIMNVCTFDRSAPNYCRVHEMQAERAKADHLVMRIIETGKRPILVGLLPQWGNF
jgi:hypothetical protein